MKMLTLVASLWICTSLSAFGADFKIITGKISNFSGEPLVGATLIVKSEDINLGGIASGLDGKYIIKVSGKTDQPLTLKVTSIGYEEKTAQILPTSDSSTVNFILNEKPIEYGTIVVSPKPRKTELMTTLSSDQINLASQRSLVVPIRSALSGNHRLFARVLVNHRKFASMAPVRYTI
jgi:hypothetical protein